MNKYQEALNYVKNSIQYVNSDWGQDDFSEEEKEYVKLLQELVDKESEKGVMMNKYSSALDVILENMDYKTYDVQTQCLVDTAVDTIRDLVDQQKNSYFRRS